jgi:hypothetical protein
MNIPGTGMVRELPQIGAVVRVTTRQPNYYYFTAEEQPFVDHVYDGTVLPPDRTDKPNTFNMTCVGTNMRHRQIPMGYVIQIEYLKGKGVKTDFRAFRVKSGDKVYLITAANGRTECDCLGFKYRRKCKHSNAVLEQLKKRK